MRRLILEMDARPDLVEILPVVLNLVTHMVDSDQVRALLEDSMFDSILRKVPPRPGSYAWEMQELLQTKVAEAREEARAVARQEALAEGEARGESRGESREALRFVKRLIARKFGLPEPTLSDRLETLSVEKLEALGTALFDMDAPADLDDWFDTRA